MPDAAVQAQVSESHVRQLGRWKKKTMVRVYQSDTQAIPLAITRELCQFFAAGWAPSVAPAASRPCTKLKLASSLSDPSVGDHNAGGSSEEEGSIVEIDSSLV